MSEQYKQAVLDVQKYWYEYQEATQQEQEDIAYSKFLEAKDELKKYCNKHIEAGIDEELWKIRLQAALRIIRKLKV